MRVAANNILAIQIKRKTAQINGAIEYDLFERIREIFFFFGGKRRILKHAVSNGQTVRFFGHNVQYNFFIKR